MFNVTVIFTRHDQIGNCNSSELLKIVKALQPEVIFEELSHSIYDQIYIQQIRSKLESDVIKLYSKTNVVEHIPVDTFDCPDNYHSRLNYLLDVISKYLNKSVALNNSFNRLMNHVMEEGFRFLNSDENDVMIEDITEQENHILVEIGDDRLDQIAQLRREVDSRREDVIIDNIYKHAEQKAFHTGILFIGSGHRKSIKSKLDNKASREGVDVKWHYLVN